MAKKKKIKPLLGVVMFLIVASLAAAGTFAYLYFKGINDLEHSTEELSKTKGQHDQLLSNVSDLQSRLASAEEQRRQMEMAGKEMKGKAYSLLTDSCDSTNCLLSSPNDSTCGLTTVKGYYRKLEKTGDQGVEFCPALVLSEADPEMLKIWEKQSSSTPAVLEISYGALSAADKNAIRASTEDSPVSVTLFVDEVKFGVGLEGLACYSPWVAIGVK